MGEACDGNRAMSVAPFHDATGRPIVGVAAAESGGYMVQVGEACHRGYGACQLCDPNTATCVQDASLDSGCCQRASAYEQYRDALAVSDPRKLFAQKLECVGEGICQALGSGGSRFDAPDWMLCLNAALFERFQSRQPNSDCWQKAEAICDAAAVLPLPQLQQHACFGAMSYCHDGRDMADALSNECGCGTSNDWEQVRSVVTACVQSGVPAYLADVAARALISARQLLTSCE